MKRWMFGWVVGVMSLALVASTATAAKVATVKAKAKTTKKAMNERAMKTTILTFKEDSIQGDITRPYGDVIGGTIHKVKLESMIQLRPDFKKRILQDLNDL
ncbi:MAG: hypothetical protein EP343_02115 [Deltaproteobacteria bacterium]|nr:MAG: hypothetical protein EP343_02115 [Deltaproteobacteria bacterium]